MRIGSTYDSRLNACHFRVWAPHRQQVSVQLTLPGQAQPQVQPMQQDGQGYWQLSVPDAQPGTRYVYQLDDDLTLPDPASHYQPDDVHGASCVVDHDAFPWQDVSWRNLSLDELIIYELHVGTFTPEGTFNAIIPRLTALKELGVNAIDIMPVAQCPGNRNWGYDGVYPFAVQDSYGGPDEFKALVNACHQQGIAVILDVVYNHLGPEGNYTSNFGPYFTDKYNTPWGSALNYDDAYCQGVREFFLENALYWFRDYHIDGLRLDAIHAIYDFGAKHFLAELAEAVAHLSGQVGKPHYLIAESDLNDIRILQPPEQGGYSMDAQWSDDFHHALHTVLTGENRGYYQDFGSCTQLAKAIQDSFVYDWQYSAYRQRNHGNFAGNLPPSQFVVYAQNHDQVGNRMLGERLTTLVSFEALKLAAGSVLLSPNIPMLFMGEEYGETAPFQYFISHSDTNLIEAVREGRKREFTAFHAVGEPPDANGIETFEGCILNWQVRNTGEHGTLLQFYKTLIQLRRSLVALKSLTREGLQVNCWEAEKVIRVQRSVGSDAVQYWMNFSPTSSTIEFPVIGQVWQKQLDSADYHWRGPGSSLPLQLEEPTVLTLPPHSIVLYQQLR